MTAVFIDNTEQGALVCPTCKGHNLHQGAVHVWQRYTEDATTGTYTCADHKSSRVETEADMEGNPSRRRDGMTIEFECESCFGQPTPHANPADQKKNYLHIVQHKGTTYLSWNNLPM
jgi:hypothetical protein